LSAERLQRLYLSEITSDPETFTACTETIVRQVEDIGRMVDEFSTFARMPEPKLELENLTEICRDVTFLEKNRDTSIEFDVNIDVPAIDLICDRRQISRALGNVIKNAAESINASDERTEVGCVHLSIEVQAESSGGGGEGEIRVIVEDNGRGLPTKSRDRLTEPYVTTREKGTGLGLAIVKKIMEDHGGALIIEDRDGPGARVILLFHSNSCLIVDTVRKKTNTDAMQTNTNLSTKPELSG
jgi:two-component system nitrogen regulation sensor histidine kinase NtrY